MKKVIYFTIFLYMMGLLFACPGWSLHEKSAETRIEELSQRIEQLEKQTNKTDAFFRWFDKITISGLLEVEAGYNKFDPNASGERGEELSDIVLAACELGIDATFNDHIAGHVLFLWEEDDTEPVDLDEGFISLTGTEQIPVYLHAGRLYVPFGNYESFFISDPFTLELGETRESAVVVGYHNDILNISAGGFNGDVDETGAKNHIESFFAGAEWSLPEDVIPDFNLAAGISYISNIADSDGLSDVNDLDEDGDPDGIRDYVGGFSGHISASFKDSVFCVAEYVCAVDDFEDGELQFEGVNIKQPKAWTAEIAYVTPSDIGFGVQYEGTDDCGKFLPEVSYGGVVFCYPFENTYVGVEYLYQEYENNDKNEVVTAQLAYEF